MKKTKINEVTNGFGDAHIKAPSRKHVQSIL